MKSVLSALKCYGAPQLPVVNEVFGWSRKMRSVSGEQTDNHQKNDGGVVRLRISQQRYHELAMNAGNVNVCQWARINVW